MDFKVLFICFISLVLVNTEKVSYEGYKLYKVEPKTEEEVKILQDVQKNRLGIFWEEHFGIGLNVKVMVTEENHEEFKAKTANLEAKMVIENIQRAIDDQLKPPTSASRDSTAFHSLTWDTYYDLEAIYAWLDELAEAYPDIVTPVVMGTSYEGREIRGIVINYVPVVNWYSGMLEGTTHAREWISPATVTWIIKEFLTSTDPEVRLLAESFQWHIFPVVNPDGYAYTFSNNRMWRKNRNPSYFTSCNETQVDDDMSNGVDLNRNYDFVWNSVGTSPDPCNNLYAGPSPASEVEAQALVRYVLDLTSRSQLIYYIAFHSYTQLIIVPYSHVNGFEGMAATNYADMYEIAIRGADRMKLKYGTEYTVGGSVDVMYAMSGTSFDWVKHATEVPVCYLIELRDLGDFGFLLPPNQIMPTGIETMEFLLEMNKNTRAMGYYLWPLSSANSIHRFSVAFIVAALMMLR